MTPSLRAGRSDCSEPPVPFSQHALHVTDEAVDVALARRLVDDVLVVVVAQATAQLLVVHLRFVLALTPAFGHLRDQRNHTSIIIYLSILCMEFN